MVEKKHFFLHFFLIQHSIASSKLAHVNDMNAKLGGKNIHESLNSNRIEEEQIEIVPKMTSDIQKTCENVSFSAESIKDCRSETEHNENNNYEKTSVLAECSGCETISEVKNEGPGSIEEVQECETMKQSAEAVIDIDQSRLDENRRSAIKFFCENLDELKDNFQSLEFTQNEGMA